MVGNRREVGRWRTHDRSAVSRRRPRRRDRGGGHAADGRGRCGERDRVHPQAAAGAAGGGDGGEGAGAEGEEEGGGLIKRRAVPTRLGLKHIALEAWLIEVFAASLKPEQAELHFHFRRCYLSLVQACFLIPV